MSHLQLIIYVLMQSFVQYNYCEMNLLAGRPHHPLPSLLVLHQCPAKEIMSATEKIFYTLTASLFHLWTEQDSQLYLGKYCFKISYLQQHLALQEGRGLQGIQQDPLRERNETHSVRHFHWILVWRTWLVIYSDVVLVYLVTTRLRCIPLPCKHKI